MTTLMRIALQLIIATIVAQKMAKRYSVPTRNGISSHVNTMQWVCVCVAVAV